MVLSFLFMIAMKVKRYLHPRNCLVSLCLSSWLWLLIHTHFGLVLNCLLWWCQFLFYMLVLCVGFIQHLDLIIRFFMKNYTCKWILNSIIQICLNKGTIKYSNLVNCKFVDNNGRTNLKRILRFNE